MLWGGEVPCDEVKDTGKLRPPVMRGKALVRNSVVLQFIALSCLLTSVSPLLN